MPIEGNTILDALCDNARRVPERPALRRRVGPRWETLSWHAYRSAVAEVTAGLAELGVAPGQQVAVLSANRVEWHLADLGILANGSVTVPVYVTAAPDQIAWILGNAEVVVCFVENHELLAKVLEVRRSLARLHRVVVFDSEGSLADPLLMGMAELRRLGATRLAREPDLFDARVSALAPEQLASIVYTSGATGRPKGAMITHANIMWTLRAAVEFLQARPGERFLSFLPLSHVAERMMSDFAPIALTGETWFARSLATVAEDLRDCRPTVFLAVPRVWEKLREAIEERLGAERIVARVVARGYFGLGSHVVAAHRSAQRAPTWERLGYRGLDATVGTRIRRQLGLDMAHLLITSAAPAHPGLIAWFHSAGLPVIDLYGQTETCGPTTANPPDDIRIGTVGKPLPGVALRLAGNGEILVRGGNVCSGYFREQASTDQLIDAAGWLHSGDVGRMDSDGYLTITGRMKDVIVTVAGQNVSPQEIEVDLAHHDLISEAVVIGEGRRYLTALVTLDAEALARWASGRGKLSDYEALATDPDLHAEIDRIVEEVNSRHARVENIRKYRILAHDLTVAAGELTPTLKVRRDAVNCAYRELIDQMYAEPA